MRMTRTGRILWVGLLWLLLLAPWEPSAFAQASQGCITAKCHVGLDQAKWVHGPVGAGACTICHTTEDESKHEFKMAAEGSDLCFGCHDTNRDMTTKAHVHKPVADGNCTQCHDPHASENRYTLRAEAADLCFICHDAQKFSDEFVHPPVEDGECLSCHNPHSSDHEFNLVVPRDAICAECHVEAEDAPGWRHPHQPVSESCTNCHSPHANKARFLLPQDPPGLCLGCHEELNGYEDVVTPHAPVANGACLECHQVHGSENPRLFPVSPTELCFKCHADLGGYVSAQSFRHGPVQQGDCSACHNPHGSDNSRILRKYFPKEFYTPFADEKYELCFECHNHQLVENARTSTLTDFRDGDRNLHYLHVNKQEKGRSCRACHQVHASSQAKHVRVSVPYGSMDWELPVEFTKTSNGGSCVVGCHAPKEYSR